MVCHQIQGNVHREHIPETEKIPVEFEWFEMEKHRLHKTAADGTEIGIAVEEPLRDGDILARENDRVYAVSLLKTQLIEVSVSSMKEMGRLCFELGNRHMSLKIEEQRVLTPYDPTTLEYLKKIGFAAEAAEGEFWDYIICRGHGHEHH